MRLIKTSFSYLVCVLVLFSFMPSVSFASQVNSSSEINDNDIIFEELVEDSDVVKAASSTAYDAQFAGYYDKAASRDALSEINNARLRKGLNALVWDNHSEDYVMERAMELAILYSFTRPDGSDGTEWWHGYTDGSVQEYVRQCLAKMDQSEPIWKEDLTVCIPSVVVVNDVSFFAVGISTVEDADSTPINDSDWYGFTISVKDGYLDPVACFMNTNKETVNPIPVTTGKTFNYWIYNTNKYINDSSFNSVVFQEQYGLSSNPDVATIDNEGTVITKKAGVTEITVKPAAESEIAFSQTVVVKPGKVTGVKLTTPKKKTIKVTWKPIAGASGYQIYRSTKKSSGFKLVKTIANGSTKSWTNTKLKKKTYYFKVRAYVKSDSTLHPGTFSTIVKKKAK